MRAGKPLEPEGPIRVVDIYKEQCHLLWEPPVDDGGLGIDYYLVEMQDVSSGRKWTEVGRIQGDTQCGIPNLEPGKKYKFRVRACNQEGESEPLATEKEVLARDPWGLSFLHWYVTLTFEQSFTCYVGHVGTCSVAHVICYLRVLSLFTFIQQSNWALADWLINQNSCIIKHRSSKQAWQARSSGLR